jgi:hypothetical protein
MGWVGEISPGSDRLDTRKGMATAESSSRAAPAAMTVRR